MLEYANSNNDCLDRGHLRIWCAIVMNESALEKLGKRGLRCSFRRSRKSHGDLLKIYRTKGN